MRLVNKVTSRPVALALIWLALGLTAVSSHAETDWEAKYKEICSYDGMCGKLKKGDVWTPPEADVVDVLRTSRPIIQAAAKLYGVDPRAIAGCILTENSLNLRLKHQAETWVATFLKNSDHSIFGKRFGSGIGQLHDDIAFDVEPRAAAMEKRPQLKDLGKVHERMETIEGSIYYVAAILKDAQDIYRKYGFDITKDIGLQTTLYNLGQYETRAKDTKSNKRQPRINHFGFFVQHNEPLLASIVGMNAGAPSAAMILGAASPESHAANTAAKGNASNSSARAVELTAKSKPKATVLKESLDVANLPDLCDQSTAKKKIGTLPKDIPYRVIAQDVDCDLGKWSLVSSSDGTVGWVKDSVLQSKTSETTSYTDCKAEIDAPCSMSIKSAKNSSLHAEKSGLFTYNLKKIKDCNAAAESDDLDEDISADNAPGTPGLKDTLSPDEKMSLRNAIDSWSGKILDLPNNGRDNPKIKRISDAFSKTPTYGQSLRYMRSYTLTFMTKSNYQKLLSFFSNPIPSEMSEETSKDIEKAMGQTAVFGSFVDRIFVSTIQACSKVPDDYQQTSRFLRDYTLDLMARFSQNSYSITGPYTKAAEELKSFCTREFSALNPTPIPTSASSTSALSKSASQVTGECVRPSEAESGKLTKSIQDAQTACAKLAMSDQALFKKAKSQLKSASEEKLAEVRECGFDLKDASKNLKKLSTTGCVKDIYVDSATSFEFMAAQKINTIYKPASTDGQFIITPKQNNSCANASGSSSGGKAQ